MYNLLCSNTKFRMHHCTVCSIPTIYPQYHSVFVRAAGGLPSDIVLVRLTECARLVPELPFDDSSFSFPAFSIRLIASERCIIVRGEVVAVALDDKEEDDTVAVVEDNPPLLHVLTDVDALLTFGTVVVVSTTGGSGGLGISRLRCEDGADGTLFGGKCCCWCCVDDDGGNWCRC